VEVDPDNVTVDLALVALSSRLLGLALATAELNALAVTEFHLHPAPVVGVSNGGVARVNLGKLALGVNLLGSGSASLGVEASSYG